MFDDSHLLPPDQDTLLATILGYEIREDPQRRFWIHADDLNAPFSVQRHYGAGLASCDACHRPLAYQELYAWFDGEARPTLCLACAEDVRTDGFGHPCFADLRGLGQPCRCTDCTPED